MTTLESRIDGVKLSFVQQALLQEESKQQLDHQVELCLATSQIQHYWEHKIDLEGWSGVLGVVNWGVFAVNEGILRTSDQLTKPG